MGEILIHFCASSAQTNYLLLAKVQRNFVLQKRTAERAGQGRDQGGDKRGSAEEARHERQVGEKLQS